MSRQRRPATLLRVVLVEGHDLTREGLSDQLNAEPDIEVVGAVATVAEAVDVVAAWVPQVVVADVQLPDGVALCERIQAISPTTQCIIHTSIEINPEAAIKAGAFGVVLKQLSGTELLAAIRKSGGPGRSERSSGSRG